MKKLLSVLLALCMVISMVTVAAVSVGAAEVGAGAATGASARTIYVGVVDYLNLNANNYQVHYWGGSDDANDVTLTATGKTVQQAVGSAYWSNQPKPFNMYTASIPADATGYKVHNGDTWFGSTDGNTANNNTAYVFEYGGNYNAFYATTQEQEEPTQPATEDTQPATDAPEQRPYTMYVDLTAVLSEGGSNWYAWTWQDGKEGEWVNIEKFGYVSVYKNVVFASFNVTPPNWNNVVSQTVDIVVEDGNTLYVLNEKENNKFKVKWKTEPATDEPTEPATDEPGTEPETQPGTEPETQPGTDEPAEGAYYIIGTMTGWAVNDDYKLTTNEASEGEYMFLGLELAADDQFKVVYSEDGSDATTWYPDGMGNNYGENGEIKAAGTYDVYFRPDGQGGEDWFYGVMYVAAQEQPTDEPTEPTEPATDEPTEPTEPATDKPTEPATDVPVTEIDLDGDYYLVGYINGADYSGSDYKFTDGTLTASFASTSYVCIKDAEGNWYMTNGFDATATEVTLYSTDITGEDSNKMLVPAGKATFTLKAYSDGTFKLSYVTEEITTDEPTEPTEPASDEPTEPVVGAGAYYIVGTMNDWTPADEYKLTENEAAEGEYVLTGLELTKESEFKVVYYNASILDGGMVWYPDGTGNNYGENGEITAAGTYDVYFRPDGQGGEDWFYNVIYVAAQEQPTEPATDEPTEPTEPATDKPTEPIETTEPVVGAGAYYIVGTMNDWTPADEYKLTENEAAEGEYMFTGLELTTTSQFKVMYQPPEGEDGVVWYPDGMGNNYGENGEITADGTYDVYFRPDGQGGEDWFYGVMYVVAQEQPTDEPTEPTEPATDEPTEPTEPATDEPTQPGTEAEVTEIELDGDFFLVGYIGGADYNGNDYKFTEGKLTATFADTSYVCIKNADGDWYMTNGFDPEATEAILYKADSENREKLMVPAGKATFTLKAYSDGTYKLSYVTEEVTTDEPTEPVIGEGAYYIIGTMTEWAVNEDYKLTANEASEGEYMFLGLELAADDQFKVVYFNAGILGGGKVWYPDGSGNNYGENGEITAAGTYDVYFRPDGQGGEDWFYNVIYVAAQGEPGTEPESQPGTEPETQPGTEPETQPGTEPETQPGTDAPTEGAYYIVGTMNDWTASDEYKLTKNEAATDNEEYMFEGLALTTTSEFKVVYTTGDAATAVWYPDGQDNNYGQNGEITADGTYTVYFRPNYDGFEDWFNSCIIAIADEQPGTEPTEPGTEPTEPGTEPSEPGTEPTEPGEEDTVIVAGSEAEIFGTGWDGINEDNLMTKQGDGTYTKGYTVEKAYDAVQLKAVVNGADWIGDLTGNNVTFNLKDAGTFTVIYHPAVGEDPAYVEVTGDIVEFITEFTYNTVYAAGNGEGYWLNGADWDPAYAANEMTEIADDVWEISFENVPDGFERQIKFAIDGKWTHNFGGAFEDSGVETVAVYNGDNITFDTDDICTVKAQLDLTEFDFTTKEGAKFTITITYEDEPLLGDIDGDGEVTINDATMLQRYFAEFIDLTDDQLAVADVNEDGKVNIRDVTAIQRMVAEF